MEMILCVVLQYVERNMYRYIPNIVERELLFLVKFFLVEIL